jgi:hypothetical protein
MFVKAYTYNNRRLWKLGLRLLKELVAYRKTEKAEHLRKTVLAIRHRRQVVFSRIVKVWAGWATKSIHKRQLVYEQLVERTRIRRMKPVLHGWRTYTENARTAAEWFTKMSKGIDEMNPQGEQRDFFTRMLKWDLRVMIFG